MAKIVAAEDDKLISGSLCDALKAAGHEPTPAYDGEEALAKIKEVMPDLVLLDIMMPKMDGFEVLKRLKSAPETSTIPVILLTAKGQYEDILKGYKEGADYYIPKPFISAHLLTAIDLVLGRPKT